MYRGYRNLGFFGSRRPSIAGFNVHSMSSFFDFDRLQCRGRIFYISKSMDKFLLRLFPFTHDASIFYLATCEVSSPRLCVVRHRRMDSCLQNSLRGTPSVAWRTFPRRHQRISQCVTGDISSVHICLPIYPPFFCTGGVGSVHCRGLVLHFPGVCSSYRSTPVWVKIW